MRAIIYKQLLRDVGRRIAEIRADRDLSQDQLAARLRVSARYVRMVEAGDENLSLTSLARIANRLNTPLVSFLDAPSRHPRKGRPKRLRAK